MADFVRTSIQAAIIIFGAHWLLERLRQQKEQSEMISALKKWAQSGLPDLSPDNEQLPSHEMEKELEMLMLQNGTADGVMNADVGVSPYEVIENNPQVLPKTANAPLTVRAAFEHLSPLADSINEIYASNQKPTNFEKYNFAGRQTNVYPYTSNKLRRLHQHRARFQQTFADQYSAAGPILGFDPMGGQYMTF